MERSENKSLVFHPHVTILALDSKKNGVLQKNDLTHEEGTTTVTTNLFDNK